MTCEGGCLCGATRYQSTGEPYQRFICHCRDCQRAGGSAFHAGMAVPRAGFSLTKGALTAFSSNGDSGRAVVRKFCPTCGSGIINEPAIWPDHVVIRIGSLDDPSQFAPAWETFTAQRHPWLTIRTEK